MQYTDDIKELGNTKYISIPIKICRVLKLKKGDYVEITINKINENRGKKSEL